jgi:hypothetical protein
MATVPALADMIGNNFGGGMITNLVAFLIITTIVGYRRKKECGRPIMDDITSTLIDSAIFTGVGYMVLPTVISMLPLLNIPFMVLEFVPFGAAIANGLIVMIAFVMFRTFTKC